MTQMTSRKAWLVIFSGLPGVGKSTLAQGVARQLRAVYLRIDTIEQAIRDLCSIEVQAEGYRLAYKIAADNLVLGQTVVADACNPISLSRSEWEQTAKNARVPFVNIEVVCGDSDEHRTRVELRVSDIEGLRLPAWDEIERRQFQAWSTERIVVDTSGHSPSACLRELMKELEIVFASTA